MRAVKSYIHMKLKSRIFQAIVLIFILLFQIQLTSAQVAKKDTTHVRLEEVVIIAPTFPRANEGESQKIEILGKKELQNTQSQTTADLVQNISGVTMQKSQQGGGSPIIRGFESNRILLLVDGIRLNNLISRGGHLQNILLLSTEQLDRIEVVNGAASTLYGNDALGGAICAFTPGPLFPTNGSKNLLIGAHMRLASVNYEKNAALKIQYSNDRWYSLSSFHFVKFNDLKMGKNKNPFADDFFGLRNYYVDRINDKDTLVKNKDPFLQVKSFYSQYNVLQKIGFKASESTTHEFTFLHSKSSDVARYDRLTDLNANGYLKYAEWYYGPQSLSLFAYHLKHKNESRYFQKVDFNLHHQVFQESRHQRLWQSDLRDHRQEKVKTFGSRFTAMHKGQKSELQVGYDLNFNSLRSSAFRENILTLQNSDLDTRYPDGNNRYMEIAAHVFHAYQYNDDLKLNGGLRIGYANLFSTLKDTMFFQLPFRQIHQKNFLYAASIGAVLKLDTYTQITGNISTGYRVPNVDDLSKIFESSPGNLIVPNPNLKPESTINYEIGLTQYFLKRDWNLQLFYTDYRIKIALNEFQYQEQDSIFYQGAWSRVLANQNNDKAYIYGFQFTFNQKLSNDLGVHAQGSYTFGRIQNDSLDVPLDHISPFTMRIGVHIEYQKTFTQFYLQGQSKKKLIDYSSSGEDNLAYSDPNGSPAWFTVNLKTSYSPLSNITIHAGIENILDTQYRTFASGINAPGRNFYLGLSLNP